MNAVAGMWRSESHNRWPARRYWAVSLLVHALLLLWITQREVKDAAAPPLKVALSMPAAAHSLPPSLPLPPPQTQPSQTTHQTLPTPHTASEAPPAFVIPGPVEASSAQPAPAAPVSPTSTAPAATTLADKPLADSTLLSRAVSQRMNAKKRYPRRALQLGMEGRVVIEAVINERGQVVGATIRESSGFELLDQDAMALLKAVTPLDIDTHRLAASTRVLIPMRYELE